MSYQSPELKEIPDVVSPADREKLLSGLAELNQESKTLLYEELVEAYESHPFFLVRLAEMVAAYRSGSIAISLFRQAQARLLEIGVADAGLDTLVETYESEVDAKVKEDLTASEKRAYYQVWKPTRRHIFPTNLPYYPPGHQEVKDQWSTLAPAGSAFFQDYLYKLIIETNHLESTYLLTEESTLDIVRRGIADGVVHCRPESALHDAKKIKSILNDTLAAYDLLLPLVENPTTLDRATLCRIHKILMNSCKITNTTYISPGVTRSVTRKTVFVAGAYSIQCCPFDQVDAELDVICNLGKQWTKTWRNPFATASWIHLVLVRCHPFEDGNGRLARLIASVPLMRHGYPPICIALSQLTTYYDAINKAYTGDHNALARCILEGMRETIASVRSVKDPE